VSQEYAAALWFVVLLLWYFRKLYRAHKWSQRRRGR
jgi:flagellar biogenesis protein FliO